MNTYIGYATTEDEIYFWFCDCNNLLEAGECINECYEKYVKEKLKINIQDLRFSESLYKDYLSDYVAEGNLLDRKIFPCNGLYVCYEKQYGKEYGKF